MIIDFHAHAFPDDLAIKAMTTLQQGCEIKPKLDGKISSLLKSMDKAGIDKSIICSIATKPSQFDSILEWSKKISSDRIIPLPSIHPDDIEVNEKIKILFNEGFKGIKLHPYYQNFVLNEEKLFPLYEALQKYKLILVSHTGFDIAFPKNRIADPVKILEITNKFKELKFIATHFGGWQDWDEVEKYLIGKNIFLEISFSLDLMDKNKLLLFFKKHPQGYILFGTDSPWKGQKDTLDLITSLNLNDDLKHNILYRNAVRLLNI